MTIRKIIFTELNTFHLVMVDELTEQDITTAFYTINGVPFAKGRVCNSADSFYKKVCKEIGVPYIKKKRML